MATMDDWTGNASAVTVPSGSGFAFDVPARKRSPAILWDDVKAGLDFVAHNLPFAHSFFTRINPYPRPWTVVKVPGHDGAELAGVYAPGRPGGGAILMAPGTFQTKDDTSRKRRAIDLWRDLGAHVLVLDLRGFGGSHEHRGTAGYLEARDLHPAADWLRDRSGVSRVTLWGESLGGAAALLAGALPGAEERFEKVLAWSPFAELVDATRIASPTHPRGRTLAGVFYRALIRVRTRREAGNFDDYLERQANALGMSRAEFAFSASPVAHMRDLQVPAFVFHAEDDPIVPVKHARLFASEAGTHAPRLHVEILPRGNHLLFDREAPEWYRLVTRAHIPGVP